MDISLNISATPVIGKTKKAPGYKKEFFKPQFKRELKKSQRQKSKIDSVDETIAAPATRVKQKSLAAIVAKNLNLARSKAEQNIDKLKPETSNLVSFAKSGSPTTSVKTVLAKKRDESLNLKKKSLVDVFGGGFKSADSSESQTSLIQTLSETASANFSKPEKRKLDETEEKTEFKKAKRILVAKTEKKNFSQINTDDGIPAKITTGRIPASGKVSSLFGNNPEIPSMGQRLVKPINEAVFSGTKFTDFDLHAFMVSNLEQNMKITDLTTVQQMAIPEIMSGKDVLVRSQTGSGKTLAYAIPIIESLHKIRPKLTRDSGLKVLVVVPTRELALQTYECFLKLVKPFSWIVPGYLVGGEKRKAEKARLRKGCAVLVATPGRLLDHIKHTEALRLQQVKCFVLDEADRMLDMGYEKDISGIVAALEEQKGLPLFGANKSIKIDNGGRNSEDSGGYDPLKMLRQNGRKVFSEEDIEKIDKEEGNCSQVGKEMVDFESKENDPKEKSEEEKEEEEEIIINREYHSGTDSDIESAEKSLPIRIQKNKKLKENSSFLLRRNKKGLNKMLVSRHKIAPEFSDDEEKEIEKNDEDVGDDSNDKKESPIVVNESNSSSIKRQTILLSATLTQAVEKLAGLTMDNPVIVDAAKENLEKSGGNLNEINEDLIVPQSVSQSYVVTPAKLRLVSLSAYIAGKSQSPGQHKTLVFMATQDMVDYHADIMSSVLCKPSNDQDEDSEPLVDADFFKLHGNMTQKERTEVFRTFRSAKSGVLLCTDVAARGLDLPKVDSVVQYTGPLSARDYVHRVGRTARAGSSGSAVIFLTPSEVGFVRMLESRRIRIRQEEMSGILDKLMGPLSIHNSVEAAATALQNQFENMIIEDKDLHKKACKAYVSWMRFYASYPKDMREVFDRRELHLGHFAKSFGLRDPPQRIGGIGKIIDDNDPRNTNKHDNRLSNERGKQVFVNKREGGGKRGDNSLAGKIGALKKVRMLNTSEYGSGLDGVKKQKPKKKK